MIALSALELVMVEAGRSAVDAFAALPAVVRRVEACGYRRFWVAEHHVTAASACVSPPVLAAHLAAATSRIRVGSGGVLAPNHAPLAVAEQFATLAALHPGRIDLGIGRGPGTLDPRVIQALRRGAEEDYPADVRDILGYLGAESALRVLPGPATPPEPWLLVSSVAGAELAAELGLPIAFAHNIRPMNTRESLERYRDKFRPSRWSPEPYVILAVETVCADTDEQAEHAAAPINVLKSRLLAGGGGEVELLAPEEAAAYEIPAELAEPLAGFLASQAYGGPETVARRLTALVEETGADELMLSTPVFDGEVRARSYELVSKGLVSVPGG